MSGTRTKTRIPPDTVVGGAKSVSNPLGNSAQLIILMEVRFASDNTDWIA